MSLRLMLHLAAATAVTATALAAAAPAPAATSPGWRVTRVFPVNSEFGSIAATSASDAWAAGFSCGSPCSAEPLLAAHWNGTAWRKLAPPAGLSSSVGNAVVAASSASNAWFFANIGASTDYAEALRWNGTAWGAGTKFPAWSAIKAAVTFGSTRAWAFGQAGDTTVTPYVVRWNGIKWARVAFPIFPQDASATSASNIWVIGETPATSTTASRVAVAAWNGSRWRKVTLPRISLPAGESLQPQNIIAAGAKNVWADAFPTKGQGVAEGIVLLHWNGTAWSRVKVPYTSYAPDYLASDGAGGIWLASYNGSFQPVFYHDSKGAWSKVAVPAPAGNTTQLGGLAHIPGTRSVWGAGLTYPTPNNPYDIGQGAILKYGP